MAMSGTGAAAEHPAIEARGLAAGYGRTEVLTDLTFAVAPGEVYALIGRNGSGKSTLVASLLGFRPRRAGDLALLGRDPWRERARLMRDVGFVPESPDAPPDARLDRIASFLARLYPSWDAAALAARLDRFGIPAAKRFGRLSRGQQGLASLALALAPAPRLLVLDDPTLGFDAVARTIFFEELIDELATRGVTVFLTSHELAEVERVADRIGLLHGGRLVAEGAPDALTGRDGGDSFRTLEELLRATTEERRKSA
jgi:ABC-2 type transport system ATP-binding protein